MLVAATLFLCRSAAGLTVATSGARWQLHHAPHALHRSYATRARYARATVAIEEYATPTLDERLVSEEPNVVLASLRARKSSDDLLNAVHRIGDLTRERARLVEEGNEARAERKALSNQIGKLMKEGGTAAVDEQKAQVAKATERAAEADAKVADIEAERSALFDTMPNLLDPRTPEGGGEEENVEVSSWGCDGELPTGRKWHDEVASNLGLLDMEAAAKLSGSRFAVLKGSLARLERALISFFIDMHATNHGYTEVMVPYLVGAEALRGTGQLPKFEEDLFKLSEPLNGRQGYLIPTAEVPLTNIHAGEILDESDLPIAYVAVTPCFRAEAGSHGKDTRGLFRQHQFHKVELVRICTPEQSDEQHHALVEHAEKCLQALKLPYRKMKLCSGDIGFSARLCYDLEVWLPGQERFREISSCSNCGSFQARRMNLRFRPTPEGAGKKPKPINCHTINGSGLAVGRTLVAILENYQNEDGSVTVPEVLRPYMGGLETL
mmetsp:Transcript_17168/g.36849  ORF Transcript_17168/g.36849 Transcript_17168/m.36849 type:complete len:495 (+) Transcript_17168:112-1596(+)